MPVISKGPGTSTSKNEAMNKRVLGNTCECCVRTLDSFFVKALYQSARSTFCIVSERS